MAILDHVTSTTPSFLAVVMVTSLTVTFAAMTTPRPLRQGTSMRRGQGASLLYSLLEEYDQRVPPNFQDTADEGEDTDNETTSGSRATNVSCNIYISSFDSISESTMDYSMTIFLRQRWEDQRLNFEAYSEEPLISLDSHLVSEIWVPDLFFHNEKLGHFHDITVPNRFLRIYRNGTIHYSARLSLTLSCPMKLHKFPLDTQICSIQIESYAYTTDRLVFSWDEVTPVEINTALELPQFQLHHYYFKDCTKVYSTGSYTCLQIDFVLQRDIGYYMIQTYVPSALVVILSWVSFWINIDAVPARISLGVLTILTMTTQATGVRQSLPRVSYIKAIDVWMSTCLVFVFAALLEFAIVNVLSRKEIRRMVTIKRIHQLQARAREQDTGEGGGGGGGGGEVIFHDGKFKKASYQRDPHGKDKARNADKLSRKLFPLAFVLFNIIYWTSYVLWNYNEGQEEQA